MRAVLGLVAPLLVVGLATSAWADDDKGKHGRGHGNRGQAVVIQPIRVVVPDRDRGIVYQYYRTEFSAGRCSPGLARKGNGCLPPGKAKKQWIVGRPLPPAVVYQPLPPAVVQQLEPVPPGYGYVRVDDDVLLMDMTNRMVADVVSDLNDHYDIGLD